MKTRESSILRDVYDFFSNNPDNWTRFADARDVLNRPVGALDPGAVQWCFEGRLIKETGDDPIRYVCSRAVEEHGPFGLEPYRINDSELFGLSGLLISIDHTINALETIADGEAMVRALPVRSVPPSAGEVICA